MADLLDARGRQGPLRWAACLLRWAVVGAVAVSAAYAFVQAEFFVSLAGDAMARLHPFGLLVDVFVGAAIGWMLATVSLKLLWHRWVLGVLFLVVVGGSVLLYSQPRWLVDWSAQRHGVRCYFETDQREVALTIDDGPVFGTTTQVLDILKRHEAHATFFVAGDRMVDHPAILHRIVDDGHELGNHGATDEKAMELSSEALAVSIQLAQQDLNRFSPSKTVWYRPGGGWFNQRVLRAAEQQDLEVALGSIWPYDSHIPWPTFAALQILHNVRPGAVIILHDGPHRGRRAAKILQHVLPRLSKRGYRVVTLSQLKAIAANP